MSATTGIHTRGLYGEQTTTWIRPTDKARRQATQRQYNRDSGPMAGLKTLAQAIVAVLYAIMMLPVLAIGAVLTLILVPWLILAPALVAGLVLAVVSFVVGGLG